MCVLPLGRHGQGQLVTCSGVGVCGTLRIVRNGIGVDEQAEIEMGGIKGLFPLRASHDATHDHVLVQTFSGATRALQFTSGSGGGGDDDGGDDDDDMVMAPMRLPGFVTDEYTLCCVNVIGDFVLQVTRSGAQLVTAATFDRVAAWAPPSGQRIALAAASASQLLVTTGGGRLVYLEVDVAARALVERSSVVLEHEISCLDIDTASTSLCAVGLWTDISVRLLALPSLAPLCAEPLGSKILPRSVLLRALGGALRLLVGMGDGHLVHFDVVNSDSSGTSPSLSS